HLQAQAGTVPVPIRSGKQQVVRFRFACDKSLRYVIDHVAFLSLRWSEWARAYYAGQRARGHSYHQALRALSAKWLKIIFVMWERQVPKPRRRPIPLLSADRTPPHHLTGPSASLWPGDDRLVGGSDDVLANDKALPVLGEHGGIPDRVVHGQAHEPTEQQVEVEL